MTAAAAQAALAAALEDHLGDWAAGATERILRQLHGEGWQISPDAAPDAQEG